MNDKHLSKAGILMGKKKEVSLEQYIYTHLL